MNRKMFYSKWLLKRSPSVRVEETITEISSSRIPKDMVFSQTSVNTQQLLKLVEINRLKSEKNQQVNDPTGVIIGGTTDSPSSSPLASTSFSEEFLETEPLFANTMLHETDGEFFQSLAQWCDAEEEVVQSIDPQKVSEERAHKTDTLHTQFSPQGWETFDANSPSAQTIQSYPVSPNMDGFNNSYIDYFNNTHLKNKIPFQEQFVDINELPVVISDLASENVDINMSMEPWEEYGYTKQNIHNTMPFIHQDDSMDKKLVSVIPREVERNDMIISEYIIDDGFKAPGTAAAAPAPARRGGGLSVDVHAPALPDAISTPDVLSFVEQLEREKSIVLSSNTIQEQAQPTFKESSSVDHSPHTIDYFFNSPKSEPREDSEDETPRKQVRAGRKRQRHDSEESDETYTPYKEHHTPRKYRPRKASVPIKDMIKALEGAQKDAPKSRRGRPPKMQRRDSTVSTVSNNSSMSTHEMKYRELRDKNNEASKRSRMNRKLKELQMEQLADDLEERNNKLRVQADMLTQRINELRKTFMLAVSQKKVG